MNASSSSSGVVASYDTASRRASYPPREDVLRMLCRWGVAYKSNRSSRTTATTDDDELDVEADYDAKMERVLEGQGSEDDITML